MGSISTHTATHTCVVMNYFDIIGNLAIGDEVKDFSVLTEEYGDEQEWKHLQKGVFGSVSSAKNRNGTPVAIKAVYRVPNDEKESQWRAECAIFEYQVAHELNHYGVPDMYGIYKDAKGTIYIVMELIQGEDLYDFRDLGAADDDLVDSWLYTLLHLLEEMEKNNIAHMDIKPENIMVSSAVGARKSKKWMPFILKLVDFGLAQKGNGDKFRGTLGCIAPEVYEWPEGGYLVTKADMWSLGTVLHELIMKGGAPLMRRRLKDEYRDVYAANIKRFTMDKDYVSKKLEGIHPEMTLFPEKWQKFFKPMLEGLLEFNPDARWSASKALRFIASFKMEKVLPELEAFTKDILTHVMLKN